MRAIWFMKITAVYVSSISKKRNTCVALEWTKCVSEYLKDNLAKFAEHNVSAVLVCRLCVKTLAYQLGYRSVCCYRVS